MKTFGRAIVAALALFPPLLGAQRDGVGEFTSAADIRRYVVHVPAGPEMARRPVVLVLHGCTQTAEDFAACPMVIS